MKLSKFMMSPYLFILYVGEAMQDALKKYLA
jgi:hypothetical protein